MRMRRVLASTLLIAAGAFYVPDARADPPPPGCERVPILGLNPQVREICDTPIQPDGSWTRFRSFSSPQFVRSTCGDDGYMTRNGYYCPPWAPKDSVAAYQSPVDQYVVTWDTIPPGEPGHLG